MLKLTRRQVVFHLEHLTKHLNDDLKLQAKLHGFKMKAPIKVQKWTKEDDKRMKDMAQRRYEELNKQAEAKTSSRI